VESCTLVSSFASLFTG